MAALFSLHATPHPHLWGKPSVRAVPAALIGVYDCDQGDILMPDPEAVREALPHYWRRAWDRCSGRFWFARDAKVQCDGHTIGGAAHLTLRGSRGQTLATLYALPYRFTPQTGA